MSSFDPGQLAAARRHTYALLSRLYAHGLTADLLPYARAARLAIPQPFDADAAAAEHHTLLGFDLHPYASLFLDDSGLLGGPAAVELASRYRAAGFQPTAEPDHLAMELAYVAFLLSKEATAWESGEGETAVIHPIRQQQQRFLTGHLLRWLPPVLVFLRGAPPLYAGAGALTAELLADHLAGLRANLEAAGAAPASLPPPPDLLDNPATGLKEIARYLTTPLYAGVYLGRGAIRRLARQHDLPAGFGDRGQMLANLLRTAVQYDQLPNLLETLQAALAGEQDGYDTLASQHPPLAPFTSPWSGRLAQTQQQLATMAGHAATLA